VCVGCKQITPCIARSQKHKPWRRDTKHRQHPLAAPAPTYACAVSAYRPRRMSEDRKSRPFPGFTIPSALSHPLSELRIRRALSINTRRFSQCSICACVVPPLPTRGLALKFPPGLWPAAIGPFFLSRTRSVRRQHHGGYRDVTRERRRGSRAVRQLGTGWESGIFVPLG
jgi:hypothetical protein